MDHDFSNQNGLNDKDVGAVAGVQVIDASAVLFDTLQGFDDLDRLENIAANDEDYGESIESFLPSLENIMAFSSYLRDRMEFVLNMYGFANDPEFQIELSKSGNRVQLSGERKDIKKISRLINSDGELRDGLLTILRVADQTYSILMDEPPGGKVVYLYGDGYLSLYKEE